MTPSHQVSSLLLNVAVRDQAEILCGSGRVLPLLQTLRLLRVPFEGRLRYLVRLGSGVKLLKYRAVTGLWLNGSERSLSRLLVDHWLPKWRDLLPTIAYAEE